MKSLGKNVRVFLVLVLLLTAGACSWFERPEPSGPEQVTGSGRIERAGLQVVAPDKSKLTLQAPKTDADVYAATVEILKAGVSAGVPIEVSSDRAIPETGLVLRRRYSEPLPQGASAVLAYFDTKLSTWVAVPSEISEDRLEVSARVHHLSLWDDFVATVKGTANTVGKAVKDSARAMQEFFQAAADAFADGARAAAEEGFYWVGKVFDTRVDPPTCTGPPPKWVTDVTFIEPNKNNTILWCVGRDLKHPDLLVVKARVNRGFGFGYETSAQPAWTYNETYDPQLMRDAIATVTGLDQTVGASMLAFFEGGQMVGAGKELAFGFAEDEVTQGRLGQPLVRLIVPQVPSFLMSSVAAVLTQMGLNADASWVGAAIAAATCAKDLASIDNPVSAIRPLVSCLQANDEQIAKQFAGVLVDHGFDPNTGLWRQVGGSPQSIGKFAGGLVGRASVISGLIGPVFNGFNYAAESSMDTDGGRVLTAFWDLRSVGTRVIRVNPFKPNGLIQDGWSVVDQSGPLDCSYDTASPSAMSAGTHSCGSTADSASACWASPRYPGTLMCVSPRREDEHAETLRRIRYRGELSLQAAPKDPQPFEVTLVDGTRWGLRLGGAWDSRADGLIGTYWCAGPGDCGGSVILGDEITFDKRGRRWFVRVGPLGNPGQQFPPPPWIEVKSASFIVSTFRP